MPSHFCPRINSPLPRRMGCWVTQSQAVEQKIAIKKLHILLTQRDQN